MRPKADVIVWRGAASKEAQQRREDWERMEAQRKRLEELRGERNTYNCKDRSKDK